MNRKFKIQYAIIAFVILPLSYLAGCSEELNNQVAVDKFIKHCVQGSDIQQQIDSCKCIALEYDKVLDKKEYTALSAMMEIAEKKTRFMAEGQPPVKMKFGTTGVDERALVSAMKKVQPLHRSGVCGYVQKLR